MRGTIFFRKGLRSSLSHCPPHFWVDCGRIVPAMAEGQAAIRIKSRPTAEILWRSLPFRSSGLPFPPSERPSFLFLPLFLIPRHRPCSRQPVTSDFLG